VTEPATVLAVSPHPDDELMGAPATLFALRDAGWRIVNLACSLGRAADRERRRRELVEACAAARFELVIPEDQPPIGRDDDLELAQRSIASTIGELLARSDCRLIVGPSPHDGHHGHELVGRAIRDAVEQRPGPLDVMFWSLWGEQPLPNMLVGFDDARLNELRAALQAHAGELARNPLDMLLESRSTTAAVAGPERVFGFGIEAGHHRYAELLTHVSWRPGDGWRFAAPRELDPGRALEVELGPPIGWWLHAPSALATLHAQSRI